MLSCWLLQQIRLFVDLLDDDEGKLLSLEEAQSLSQLKRHDQHHQCIGPVWRRIVTREAQIDIKYMLFQEITLRRALRDLV